MSSTEFLSSEKWSGRTNVSVHIEAHERVFCGLVFSGSAAAFVDHLCVPWCALLSAALLVSPLLVPPARHWWLWLWPVQNWAGADPAAVVWGEGIRQRGDGSSYISSAAASPSGSWNRWFPAMTGADKSSSSRGCPLQVCLFLLQRAPGTWMNIKHCHKAFCHMSHCHVVPCTQVLVSILAKLDWVVSHCPLYPLSLAGLIWKEGSHSQTQKELLWFKRPSDIRMRDLLSLKLTSD